MKMCLCQVQPAHIVCEDIIAQRYGAGSQSLQLFSTVFCCVLFVSFTRSAALESVHLSLSMNTHTYTHTLLTGANTSNVQIHGTFLCWQTDLSQSPDWSTNSGETSVLCLLLCFLFVCSLALFTACTS